MTPSRRLVIVGYGAAGAAAAITAARLGREVLVLEKQPAHRHTPSTRMSGGLVMGVSDAEAGTRYLDACAGGMVPGAVSAAWATRAVALRDWLGALAPDLELAVVGGAEQDGLSGSGSITVFQPGTAGSRLASSSGAGRAVYDALTTTASDLGVEVRWDAAVRRVTRSTSGHVDGVELAGGERIEAGAVILACGGYEFDEQMKQDYLRVYPVHFYGNPGNTGDGVRIGSGPGRRPVAHEPDDRPGRRALPAAGRFTDGVHHLDRPARLRHHRPARGAVCRRVGAGEASARLLLRAVAVRAPLGGAPTRSLLLVLRRTSPPCRAATLTHIGAGGIGLYSWSADNSAEIAAGWIRQGDTVEAAARAAGVSDPARAARSVADYNAACERGDDLFGRPPSTLEPLTEPPFYCVPLWPGGSNTSGGPRRDEHARVLDVFGEPIAGLYAAGELGQPLGLRYPADGSNLSEAMCFGQIAAEHALR